MAEFSFFALGFAGWIGTLLLPPVFAIWSWNRAPRYMGYWLPHVLFAPTVLAAEWALIRMLFLVTGDTGEGTPGLGLALVPAGVVLLFVLAAYYVGVAAKVVRSAWDAMRVR